MRRGLLIALMALFAMPVGAQDRRSSHCLSIADAAPGIAYLQHANWSDPLEDNTVRISYIAHASFLLQSPGGLNVVTDFSGFAGANQMIPDVVTMNHAHETHWTAFPDPEIPHVLNGWGPFGQGIEHHLDLGELLVRNVTTDIRSNFSGIEENGNSIFVFEVAGLCIGHLGHLHHVPSDEQFAALGRLDVVMAPVDGSLTLPLFDLIDVLKRLKSSVVIPMHWFGGHALEAFLVGISEDFDIEIPGGSSLEISLRSLPKRTTVIVLLPRVLIVSE